MAAFNLLDVYNVYNIKGGQNEPTGIYFDIGGQMVHKGGAKLGFSGNFVSKLNCGKKVPNNCDA